MTDKKSLVTIAHDMANLEQKIIEQDGELDSQLENELAEISTQLATKVDSYKWRLDKLDSAIEFWRNQEVEAARIKSVLQNHKKAMEDRIKESMKAMDTMEVKGQKYSFSLHKSNPKLIIDHEKLPSKYLITITETKPDTEKIKEDLRIKTEIEGAKFESGYSLRKKMNKEIL